jgi:hypothetical protein
MFDGELPMLSSLRFAGGIMDFPAAPFYANLDTLCLEDLSWNCHITAGELLAMLRETRVLRSFDVSNVDCELGVANVDTVAVVSLMALTHFRFKASYCESSHWLVLLDAPSLHTMEVDLIEEDYDLDFFLVTVARLLPRVTTLVLSTAIWQFQPLLNFMSAVPALVRLDGRGGGIWFALSFHVIAATQQALCPDLAEVHLNACLSRPLVEALFLHRSASCFSPLLRVSVPHRNSLVGGVPTLFDCWSMEDAGLVSAVVTVPRFLFDEKGYSVGT